MEKVRKAVFVLALLVFLGSAGYLGYHFLKAYQTDSEFEGLKTEGGHDLVALHKKNPDIIGWIKVEGTKIDYPVMYTPKEPEFYLRRNFEKKESVAGTPFLDATGKPGENANYFIYGHNIKAGTMFHDLLDYEKEDFYKEHETFTYDELKDGEQVNGTYRVVAMFKTKIYPGATEAFEYYAFPSITTEKEYKEYVKGIKSLSQFDTGVMPRWPQQLVTLSTCSYHTEEGRYAVVGVKEE